MDGCFHCGEPLPRDAPIARIDDAPRSFCCTGCMAAAELIRGLGLDRYYDVRTAPAPRARPDAPDLAAWDVEAAIAPHRVVRGDTHEVVVALEGVRCAACAWLVQRVLATEPAVESAEVNPATARLRLAWRPAVAPLSALFARLVPLGYRPCLPGADDAADTRERRAALKRLAVAGLGAMQAMMFAEALYFGDGGSMDLATREFFRWIGLVVSTPVVFYAGLPFLRGARAELALHRAGMDTLVALTVLLAWLASVVETLRGGPAVYFDAAVMFVFLLLATRELERAARRRAGAVLATLARAQPDRARRVVDGIVEDVAGATLARGDVVRVAVGEAVPADGLVRGASALVSESILTGEARPVVRHAGERVLAGSVCVMRPLELEVVSGGGDTALAQVARLAQRGAARRPRAALLAERVASRFVAALLVVACGVAAAWWFVDAARVVPVTLAVLAVTCPCALSLAVPAAVAAAQSQLARRGVLALDPDALERLAAIDVVAFDKTGTLTDGDARVVEVRAPGDAARALQVAAALERDVVHPIAAALRRAATVAGTMHACDVHVTAGAGVEGTVEGVRYRLGRPGFAGAPGGVPGVVLAGPHGEIARFIIEDALRPDAPGTVAALHAAGVATRLWSGDEPVSVARVAQACGVDAWSAELAPADKLAALEHERRRGARIAMVGDGINDAPVLAAADVSFALGDGSALAQANAGFVVLGTRLEAVAATLALARRARAVVRQNLAWALAYNVLALPVAAFGWAPPWLAAVGMSVSSLVVTANAMRLARTPRAERPRAASPAATTAIADATAPPMGARA